MTEHPGPGEAEKFLFELRTWPVEKAREELLRYVGVGRKVADCVLLMSMDKVGFFPYFLHSL